MKTSQIVSTLALASVLIVGCGGRPQGDDCSYNSTTHVTGETFVAGDSCNSCTCNRGGVLGVVCSAKSCGQQVVPPGGCSYNNTIYTSGESFTAMDGFNSCVCNPQGTVGVVCTADSAPPDSTDSGDSGDDTSYCGPEGTECNNQCVNLNRDADHCGACGYACDYSKNEVCIMGACYQGY